MNQNALLAWGRVVNEPRLLELQPALGIEIVQFIGGHKSNYIVGLEFEPRRRGERRVVKFLRVLRVSAVNFLWSG